MTTTAGRRNAEPLSHILRAIVALSENIIDDQDPKAVFDPVKVNEAARAIRQTANGAMRQAAGQDAILAACKSSLALLKDPEAEAEDADRVTAELEAAILKVTA